jgi:hypothetical protein
MDALRHLARIHQDLGRRLAEVRFECARREDTRDREGHVLRVGDGWGLGGDRHRAALAAVDRGIADALAGVEQAALGLRRIAALEAPPAEVDR